MHALTIKQRFDLSDVPDPATVDRLDVVLEIAAEVVAECAAAPGNTRLERMARWLTYFLGGEPYHADRAGAIARFNCGTLTVWRVSQRAGVSFSGVRASDAKALSRNELLATAVALLRVHDEIGDDELVDTESEPEV